MTLTKAGGGKVGVPFLAVERLISIMRGILVPLLDGVRVVPPAPRAAVATLQLRLLLAGVRRDCGGVGHGRVYLVNVRLRCSHRLGDLIGEGELSLHFPWGFLNLT